jgi:acyl-CoA thioesterase-1
MRFLRYQRSTPGWWQAIWPLLLLAGTTVTGSSALADSPAAKSVVIFGDSLAAGYGVSPDDAYPAVIDRWIRETGLPFRVANAGVSGDTTAGGTRRIDWVLKRPVDVLVLELGGNDGLRGIPPAQTRSNLVSIIQKTRAAYPKVRVVIAGMQMPSNLGSDYTTAFREVFPSVARSESTTLIPFLLEGVGGVAALNQADQIHPNAEGHRRVATNVWQVLDPVLRSVATQTAVESRQPAGPAAF